MDGFIFDVNKKNNVLVMTVRRADKLNGMTAYRDNLWCRAGFAIPQSGGWGRDRQRCVIDVLISRWVARGWGVDGPCV